MEIERQEEDDVWHEREGVLLLNDPICQEYLTERAALIEKEQSQRSGKYVSRRWR
jgi:hypothetical protein